MVSASHKIALIGAYPCSNVSAPITLSITTATTCSFLTVTAVTGNFFVILAVIFDPNRTLRSRVNFLVANLAAAELIVCVYALPLSLEFHIRESMSHLSIASTPLQQDHARRVAYFLLCTASLLSLAALTRDRFIAIKEPLNYRTEINKKQAAMFSQVIWVVPCGLPFLYFQILEIFLCICEYSCSNNFVIEYFTTLCIEYFP